MQVDPGQRDQAHLQDMLDSAKQAASYVRGQTFEQFWDDAKTRDAVAMRLQAIGEAAGRVSLTTAAAMPTLPINQMRGLRNRIAHTYNKVDFKEVWKVTQHDLKPLISELERYFFQQSQRQAEAERLKLRRASDHRDPGMGRGWACEQDRKRTDRGLPRHQTL